MQQNKTLKLYIAYFVIEYTNIWHGPDGEKIIKEKQSYYIEMQMFPAETAEQAYEKATDWITGFSDSTHDGDGDLNTEKCIGINQLEYICDYDDFDKKVNAMYGLECGFIKTNDFMHNKKPVIRNKTQLEIFKYSSG